MQARNAEVAFAYSVEAALIENAKRLPELEEDVRV